MGKLPSPLTLAPTRASTILSRTAAAGSSTTSHHVCPSRIASQTATQARHATYIARPRRPYTFTQLVQLSDGSSYTVRTTSPQALHKANKDSRNTLLWQPSERTLKNVEVDEAGKLAAFRERFGRGFDQQEAEGEEGAAEGASDGGYGDLISSYAPDISREMQEKAAPAPAAGKGKKK